jgi:WD40 repeat protein
MQVFLGLAARGAAQSKPDLLGDPLPEGAVARCGTVRFLPRFAAWAVAISPDGKTVAVGSTPGSCPDSCVELWDVATGQRTGTLAAGSQNILALAWAPDGRRLAVSHDERLEIFAAVEGKLLATLPQPKGAFESLLAFRAMTGRSNAGMPRPKPARPVNWSIRWSASGERLAACSTNGNVCVWDVPSLKIVSSAYCAMKLNDLAFSSDGRQVVLAGPRLLQARDVERLGVIWKQEDASREFDSVAMSNPQTTSSNSPWH